MSCNCNMPRNLFEILRSHIPRSQLRVVILGVHHLLGLPAEGVAGVARHGERHAAVLTLGARPHRLVEAPVRLLGAPAQRPASHKTPPLGNSNSGYIKCVKMSF